MMRRAGLIISVVLCSLLLAGCYIQRHRHMWDLPESPLRFEMESDADNDMMSITAGDRKYEPYGTNKYRVDDDIIRDCLGYIGDDQNYRVYTLSEDPYDNYIMLMNVNGVMEEPQFWRATDTMGESVYTPSFIKSLDYEEWATSGSYSEMSSVDLTFRCKAENVKIISLAYQINGQTGGKIETGHADGSVIVEGQDNRFSIDEFAVDDKADKGKPFNLKIKVIVTDDKGIKHEAECDFDKEVKAGDSYLFELRGDADKGYIIYPINALIDGEMVWY